MLNYIRFERCRLVAPDILPNETKRKSPLPLPTEGSGGRGLGKRIDEIIEGRKFADDRERNGARVAIATLHNTDTIEPSLRKKSFLTPMISLS